MSPAHTIVGSRLFMNADDGVHGRELWQYEYLVGPPESKHSLPLLQR